MYDLQATMEDLRRQMEEKRELQYQMRSLRERRSTLFAEVSRLDNIRLKEQADVTRLEKPGVVSLLHRVTGKLEEKREQEQQEADAAAAAHGAALREMQEIDGQIDRILNRLEDLRDVEYRYSKAEQTHKNALKAAGGSLAKEIEDLERALGTVKSQQEANRRILGQIEMCLSSVAEVLSQNQTSEMFSAADTLGGGILVTALKQEQWDDEDAAIQHLQQRLQTLRELLPQQRGLELRDQEPRDKGLDTLDLLFELIDRSEHMSARRMIRSDLQELNSRLSSLKIVYSTRQEELDSSYRMFNRRLSELLQKGV